MRKEPASSPTDSCGPINKTARSEVGFMTQTAGPSPATGPARFSFLYGPTTVGRKSQANPERSEMPSFIFFTLRQRTTDRTGSGRARRRLIPSFSLGLRRKPNIFGLQLMPGNIFHAILQTVAAQGGVLQRLYDFRHGLRCSRSEARRNWGPGLALKWRQYNVISRWSKKREWIAARCLQTLSTLPWFAQNWTRLHKIK